MPVYVIYALLSMAFAGVTSILARQGMANVMGDTALAVRTSVVFGLVWLAVLGQRQLAGFGQLTRQDVIWLALSGCTTFGSWLFYYRAIKLGPVSEVALIDKGSIVITILLAAVVLHEPLTLRKLAALGCILIGLLLLLKK